jgi:F-type H+-transporting ATPase subunit delta
MTATQRQAVAGLRERLDARRDDPAITGLAEELFAAADLLDSDAMLRTTLSDSGQPAQARVGALREILGSRLSPLAVDTLADVVGQRWADGGELIDAIEDLGAQATFLVAEQQDSLSGVEDELFAFSQTVSGSADLQLALTDPSASRLAKAGLVRSLLEGRTNPITAELLAHAMSSLRGRRAESVVDRLMSLAAEQRGRAVAEVRTAVPLTPEQSQRLQAALSQRFGREIRLNVAVDPQVVGGVSVRIGTEVIDGTIATRLEQARRALIG